MISRMRCAQAQPIDSKSALTGLRMGKPRQLFIAIGGIALCIATTLSTTSTWATPLYYTFAVTATTGPLTGTSSTGKFTFDSSVIPDGGGEVRRPGLFGDLAFVWNGIAYDETTANTGVLRFDSQGHLVEGTFGNDCPSTLGGGCGVGAGSNQWLVYVAESAMASRFYYATPSSYVDEGTVILTTAAVEYHHRMFDHYFVTALANEIRVLDEGRFPGWSRTGQSFPTYPLDTPGTANVCRFWSGTTFALKSSHFYTPYPDECAKVKQDPVWQFEGYVFAWKMPVWGLLAAACPPDSRPLYRAYNRGMSGAPNHRYMTDPAVLGEMVAQGWQVEGDLWTRIFACVPAQE